MNRKIMTGALSGMLLFGAIGTLRAETEKPMLIPQPAEINLTGGVFMVQPKTVIQYDKEFEAAAKILQERFAVASGLKLKLLQGGKPGKSGTITFTTEGAPITNNREAYALTVTPDSIVVRAKEYSGAFYGLQTLRQLFPPALENKTLEKNVEWNAPCVKIQDAPRFSWRSFMIDSARMFPSVEMMKRYIDLMAYYKMNILHWHLVDDQGWRIEIKKYPRLTEQGAWRMHNGKKYGGFYTQEQIRDIVKYAQERNVTIVPEIDFPGHAMAAISSYPELSCAGKDVTIPDGAGIFTTSYCPGNPKVMEFFKDVFEEVHSLFPVPYVHIGGDECDKRAWKQCEKCQTKLKELNSTDVHDLHVYLVREIHEMLQKKNIRIIAWDEVSELKNLPKDILVQIWRDRLAWHPKYEETTKKAIANGNQVLMSPWNRYYMCYPHSGLVPVKKAYQFNPIPSNLTPEEAKHIIGVSGSLWTDMIFQAPESELQQYFDHYIFPRLLAHAENGWSEEKNKSFDSFTERLGHQLSVLDRYGVAYGYLVEDIDPTLYRKIADYSGDKADEIFSKDITELLTGPGLLNVKLQYKSGKNALNADWCAIDENGKEVARDEHPGSSGYFSVNNDYFLNLKKFTPGAKYTLRAKLYGKDGGKDVKGELRMVKMPPMELAGRWSKAHFAKGNPAELEWDLTPILKESGPFEVKFIYTGGNNAAEPQYAVLLKNGQKISEDKHKGSCGIGHENNVYKLALPKFTSGAKYTLKAKFLGKGGIDTNGMVWIIKSGK